jgi:predicted secreted hydrolase
MAKRVIVAEGDEFLKRGGLGARPVPWEDGLRAETGRGNFEWWYFDAHFNDGTTIVIVYLTKPLLQRSDPLTPSVQIFLTRPGREKVTLLPVYPAGQFQASKDRCDVRIGPNWVRGDLHRYTLHAESGNVAADLTFTGIAPPWRPGAGVNYYDEAQSRYFAWLPAIPYGEVAGTLTYDGQPHALYGTGYHDHNWGNVGLNEVLSHWYWGRGHLGDYSLIFAQMIATPAYARQALPIFLLAKGDRILAEDARPLTLQTGDEQTHPSGKTYAGRLDFDWQGSAGQVHLALRQPRLIEAISMLTYLPRWQQALARLFTNPYYFRFEADLELKIDLAGEHIVEHGPVLYELMILH